ncbi:MAG: ABC transporter substrate-binding protein [Candidatus Dadabacteria bacterium]|nr:MAG: ABC transporter substrate-binding protein [Candidatus Dadabacteria bacterium]
MKILFNIGRVFCSISFSGLVFWLLMPATYLWAADQDKSVTVGVILPLTGEGAFWGKNARNAITMAVEDVNKAGGINGRPLRVAIEDGRCNGRDSLTAFNKLVTVDRVKVVIGEICSTASMAMAPIAQRKKIVMITPCSEGPGITKVGDYIFRTWSPNNRQGRIMADFTFDQLKIKRVAVLSILNDFGKPLADAFISRFKERGGKITYHAEYSSSSADMRSEVLRIKQSNPGAVYMATYPADGLTALRQIKALKLDVKILGSSGLDTADFYKQAGTLADGMFIPTVIDTTTDEFRRRYSEKFGGSWPGINSCAGVAYDDMQIIAAALREVGNNPADIRSYIAAIKDMPGVSGPISFDAEGNIDMNIEVRVVRGGKLVERQ